MSISSKIKFNSLLCMLLSQMYHVNGQTNLTIKLNKKLVPSKVMIFYSDGPIKKFYSPEVKGNEILISEPIQSRFARVGLFYPNKYGLIQGTSFFVNKEKSEIYIDEVDDSTVDKVSNYKTRLVDVKKAKVYNDINKYTTKELNAYKIVNERYNRYPTDSNSKLLNKYNEIWRLKELEFIKGKGKNYFYFNKFAEEITPALIGNHLLELYEYFNGVFPAAFKNSYEGKAVKTLLEGNLFVKIGMQCPQFTTKDHLGRELGSANLKGKYYLLSFWATWCGPCIASMPAMNKALTKYNSNEQVKFLFVDTWERSENKRQNAIDFMVKNKYPFQVLLDDNNKMVTDFKVSGIPTKFVIDKNGKIRFKAIGFEGGDDDIVDELSTMIELAGK